MRPAGSAAVKMQSKKTKSRCQLPLRLPQLDTLVVQGRHLQEGERRRSVAVAQNRTKGFHPNRGRGWGTGPRQSLHEGNRRPQRRRRRDCRQQPRVSPGPENPTPSSNQHPASTSQGITTTRFGERQEKAPFGRTPPKDAWLTELQDVTTSGHRLLAAHAGRESRPKHPQQPPVAGAALPSSSGAAAPASPLPRHHTTETAGKPAIWPPPEPTSASQTARAAPHRDSGSEPAARRGTRPASGGNRHTPRRPSGRSSPPKPDPGGVAAREAAGAPQARGRQI